MMQQPKDQDREGATVLALDTALHACSAALASLDGRAFAATRAMTSGHAEALMPMLAGLLEDAGREGVPRGAIDIIAVTRGPGSFTGLRVALAAGRALGLALDRPVVGVGTLAALAASVASDAPVAAAVDARHGNVYLQAFAGNGMDGGMGDGVSLEQALGAPAVYPVEAAAAHLSALGLGAWTLVGSGAPLLADLVPTKALHPLPAPDILGVARLGRTSRDPAAPLYLRGADAKRRAVPSLRAAKPDEPEREPETEAVA